jgi:tetratricopeptide (TPR) repeat protein
LGVLLQATGRTREAEPEYRRAVDLYERLADEFRDLAAFRWSLALGHRNLATLLRDTSRLPEAERSCRQAGDLLARLAADSPSRPDYRAEWAHSLHTLAGLLEADGRPREAEPAYSRAVTLREKLAADFPGAAEYGRDLAAGRAALGWLLAACPDPHVRDATRAVEVARKAVAQAPQDPEYRGTLGVGHYRAGNWKAAVEELDRALRLAGGGSAAGYAGFFLAMAHWQLGEREQARACYAAAVRRLAAQKAKDENLDRFRAEAAELLGLAAPQKSVRESLFSPTGLRKTAPFLGQGGQNEGETAHFVPHGSAMR